MLEYIAAQAEETDRPPADGWTKRPRQKISPGVNDLATKYPDIAALWDEDRNGDSEATQILPASNKKVWWRCKEGHSWQAAPYVLTIAGSRCPYCSGRKVIPGETDLATRYPEVAKLWDEGKNHGTDPSQIMPGTKRKYWWRCKEGHSWQAAVYSLTLLQSGCPYCTGHKVVPGETDLATRFPEAAALWSAELNDGLSASQVAPRSRKTAWWQCKNGHRWQAQVHSMVVGSRCPVCVRKKRQLNSAKCQNVMQDAKYMNMNEQI